MGKSVIIIGGGAAGLFSAAVCAETAPDLSILILEKTNHPLAKVKLSGGGRCNVTNATFDPHKLTSHYPRGGKELLGPFHHFQPRDTIAWFQEHGVILKEEADGRVFPASNCSATITHCLLETAKKGGVKVRTQQQVTAVTFQEKEGRYRVAIAGDEDHYCEALLLATGGAHEGHLLAKALGHHIVDPIPSLFTLNVPDSPFSALSGVTIPDVELSLPQLGHKSRGSLLLTHFGFSGPAVLKLSAFAARDLYDCNYKTPLTINWAPSLSEQEILSLLESKCPLPLPSSLWNTLLTLSGIDPKKPLKHLSISKLKSLIHLLTHTELFVSGKSANKAELVTCGGVDLKEVDFRTMQSKLLPRLFFAGEILDIDGITGGFNFQNAWTTGYLAARAIAKLN